MLDTKKLKPGDLIQLGEEIWTVLPEPLDEIKPDDAVFRAKVTKEATPSGHPRLEQWVYEACYLIDEGVVIRTSLDTMDEVSQTKLRPASEYMDLLK